MYCVYVCPQCVVLLPCTVYIYMSTVCVSTAMYCVYVHSVWSYCYVLCICPQCVFLLLCTVYMSAVCVSTAMYCVYVHSVCFYCYVLCVCPQCVVLLCTVCMLLLLQNSRGVNLTIPMPGHAIGSEPAAMEETKKAVQQLEELIREHDVTFLLLDTRESRWLPTLMCLAYNKVSK